MTYQKQNHKKPKDNLESRVLVKSGSFKEKKKSTIRNKTTAQALVNLVSDENSDAFETKGSVRETQNLRIKDNNSLMPKENLNLVNFTETQKNYRLVEKYNRDLTQSINGRQKESSFNIQQKKSPSNKSRLLLLENRIDNVDS